MMKLSREAVTINRYRISDPGVARIIANERLTPLESDDVHHIVLDISGLDYPHLEGQSLGVLVPGLDAAGRPHKLRLYSIASSRRGDDGEGRTVSLCVKRVLIQDCGLRRGLASNFLCDAAPGDPVPITGPVGRHFVLPEDPTADLILIATGTGIAPFRAFLRRVYLEWPEFSGTVSLFFGVRHEAEILYRTELEGFRDRPGYRLSYALSREQMTEDGSRMYVQHRLAEQADEVWDRLVRGRGYGYVCGLKGMEGGIDEVLETRARAEGASWAEIRKSLAREGRWVVETY
jgi:ferredoxin--NADP+ reductase